MSHMLEFVDVIPNKLYRIIIYHKFTYNYIHIHINVYKIYNNQYMCMIRLLSNEVHRV